MNRLILIVALMLAPSTVLYAADPVAKPATAAATKPAKSKVDPAQAAAHAKEDIQRHRTIAAAHEAAAKCQESGRPETECMSDLAKACKGIAYGKYCGMKHD